MINYHFVIYCTNKEIVILILLQIIECIIYFHIFLRNPADNDL